MGALSIEGDSEKAIRRLYADGIISLNEARAALALPLSDHEHADNVLVDAPHGSSWCAFRGPTVRSTARTRMVRTMSETSRFTDVALEEFRSRLRDGEVSLPKVPELTFSDNVSQPFAAYVNGQKIADVAAGDTLADALSRIEEGYTELLSVLPDVRKGLDTIAELDNLAAVYGELFVDRLLALTGSTERVRGPATTPAPKPQPDPAVARQRVIQRTQQRLIKARQTERAAGDIADKLQACAEYAVRNTEPVDAYDLSNEERKTEDEIKTLEREIDRYRDTEARAAARAETAERVLVEMGAWPRSVG
jgi:hypothetical protein